MTIDIPSFIEQLPGIPDSIHIPEPSLLVAGIVLLIVFAKIRKKKRLTKESINQIPDL